MKRLETAVFGFFLACWCAGLPALAGLYSLADTLPIHSQSLFTLAAFQGWIVGNVYVRRSRSFPRPFWHRLLLAYLFVPPGLFFLLWAMAPAGAQRAAPLVPTLALGVSAVLFLVPVSLRNWPGGRGSADP